MNKGDLKTLSKAILYATEAHRKQKRKNSTNAPYIEHPIGVMNILIQAGVTDVNILSAAVLHDTVEDTPTTFDDIGERFGQLTLYYVKEVTDDKSLDKVTRKKLQIDHAYYISPGAKLIKLADKIHNLNSMLSDPPKGWNLVTIQGYFVWSKKVTDELYFDTENKELEDALNRLDKMLNGAWGIYRSEIKYEEEKYPVLPEIPGFLEKYYQEISEKK